MEISKATLLRWSEAIAASAMTGIGFTENLYEVERFEEMLKIASEIRATAHIDGLGISEDANSDEIFDYYHKNIGSGISGYVTPKAAIGAVVGNENGEILLIQRSDSGIWLYPTGWADVGYSPAEVAAKEVFEETGIEVEVVSLLSVIDGLRRGFTAVPLYSMLFLCRAIGGSLKAHPLECKDVGWFSRDNLPTPMIRHEAWVKMAFDAIDGKIPPTHFDQVRSPFWREG